MPRDTSTQCHPASSSDEDAPGEEQPYKLHVTLSLELKEKNRKRYSPYVVKSKLKRTEDSLSDSQLSVVPPTSYRSIAVQTTDVDDQESQDLVTKLQISIRKLENDVDFYAKEMSKYRIYWKNECRLADAAEYGWGGVSQTSWSSSSPHRAYTGNVSEDVEESSATGE